MLSSCSTNAASIDYNSFVSELPCTHEILSIIESNSHRISWLTKQKNKRAVKISATLDFLRLSKRYLSGTQIVTFVKFSAVSEASSYTLQNIAKQIDELKALGTVRDALLHNSTDIDPVHSELHELLTLQHTAIDCLENLITVSNALLQALEQPYTISHLPQTF